MAIQSLINPVLVRTRRRRLVRLLRVPRPVDRVGVVGVRAGGRLVRGGRVGGRHVGGRAGGGGDGGLVGHAAGGGRVLRGGDLDVGDFAVGLGRVGGRGRRRGVVSRVLGRGRAIAGILRCRRCVASVLGNGGVIAVWCVRVVGRILVAGGRVLGVDGGVLRLHGEHGVVAAAGLDGLAVHAGAAVLADDDAVDEERDEVEQATRGG